MATSSWSTGIRWATNTRSASTRPRSRSTTSKIRQALLYAFNQQDFLQATVGDKQYYKLCKALFVCGTPLASDKGMEGLLESNFAKAQALLKEGGYDGTPIVLMHSTDLQVLTNLAPVAKSLMEKAGFKVDMQSMDWQTLVARRAEEGSADAGRLARVHHLVGIGRHPESGVDRRSSIRAATRRLFGWPCDAQIEKLRDDFARETDPAKQKAIAEAVQVRWTQYPTHVHLGQWYQPGASRKNVDGLRGRARVGVLEYQQDGQVVSRPSEKPGTHRCSPISAAVCSRRCRSWRWSRCSSFPCCV